MTAATIPGLDTAPTKHKGLLAWVQEVAELTQPDRVVFADGSDEEFERLAAQLVDGGHLQEARTTKKKPNSYLALSDPSDVARVESRTFICSERAEDRRRPDQQLDGPRRDARHHDRPVPRLHARPHHVRGAVLHGPARRRGPQARRRDHRLRVRRRLDAHHDPDGQGRAGQDGRRRLLRQGAALDRRPAGAGPEGRAVAVQRHQVHHPLPRDPRDLELRLRLRRQRAAGQEVLLAAHRLGDGPRRGLARRAHADPQADLARRTRRTTSPRRSRRRAARPTSRCCSRPSPAGAPRPSATTSPGCGSARTAGSTRSTPSSASSASRPAPTGSPTRTR